MHIIGLMSGTSLDGLDIAYCDIREDHFELIAAETYPYSSQWVSWLSTLEKASAYEYALIDVELGHYFGQLVNHFRKAHPGHVDAIASHGHTIFHQPQLGLTTQIGDGELWGGVPAKFIKKVDPEQAQALNKTYAAHYIEYSDWFRKADSDPKNTQIVTTSEDYK